MRTFDTLTCFYLDSHPRVAAQLLTDRHICSQAHALGRLWTQIARELGLDLTAHPREKGAYPDSRLSIAGVWAMITSENWAWFRAYSTWVFCEYRLRYGAGERDHQSREYVDWVWREIDRLDLSPQPGPLTIPPIRGLTCDLPPGRQAYRPSSWEAMQACKRIYRGLPPLQTPLEEALLRLAAAVAATDSERYDRDWRASVLRYPEQAIRLMPTHPVIRALSCALSEGADHQTLRVYLLLEAA